MEVRQLVMSKPKSPLSGLAGGSEYNGNGNENKEQPSIADRLLAIVNQNVVELFEDQYNKPYIAVKIDGRTESIPISVTHNNNGLFKKWICKTYFDATQKLMSNTDAISAVSNHLSWKAHYEGGKKNLDLRVSYGDLNDSNNKTIYYDLTNKYGDIVAITKDGWSIKKSSDAPITFDRRSIQRPQVNPVPSGQYPEDIFEQFMDLLNVRKDGNDRLLLMCYIISLFIPKISKVILMLHGPEGAAKSACQLLIKWLIDPTSTRLLKLRKKEDDLILQLADNYIVYYDNVSDIPGWISDLFCMAATGTSFAKRMLYFDDQQMVFELTRPIGFNGINLAASRADILDRGLNIELEGIDENRIKLFEREILPEFERLKPYILSYIFDIVSKVLAFEHETEGKGLELKSRSRMADWEEYGEIIARCMGFNNFQFLDAYRANREKKTEVIMEESPVMQAVIKLMEVDKLMEIANGNGSGSWSQGLTGEPIWIGSYSQLFMALKPIAINELNLDVRQGELWPKAPNVLSRRLERISSSLKKLGIVIEKKHDGHTRSVKIRKIPLVSLVSSVDENHAQITSDSTNDTSNDIVTTNDIDENTVSKNDENHAQNTVTNDINDINDTFPTSTEDPRTTDPDLAKVSGYLKNLKPAGGGEWLLDK